tara:strand:+ start:63 stop:329 length:267 start_codon:yes stop_codon:yes gene_type:complete
MIHNIYFILCLVVGIANAYNQYIWFKIPKFYVRDYVNDFLDHRQINNCFYKYKDEDSLLLKCWRNNKLVDVEINIKEKSRGKHPVIYI